MSWWVHIHPHRISTSGSTVSPYSPIRLKRTGCPGLVLKLNYLYTNTVHSAMVKWSVLLI
uniref:Uncharacterized protein n=1 Tax=Anguilla anguilla TaxID=7936 RepID=A0A0E9T972_ANGAN